jgi:hypothetical protein
MALTGWIVLFWYYRAVLLALWREPMLCHPILIIESDDWGPGPKSHGQQLHRISKILERHHDARGHAAVMTLGVALALPDVKRMALNDYAHYYRQLLSPLRCPAIYGVMRRGALSGIFAVHMQGLEHYWPPTLLWAIKANEHVKAWLLSDEFPRTEELPPHLRSRWTNATSLPSRPLPEEQIKAAVSLEAKIFSRIFGNMPEVVVPPAFCWNDLVEKAWASVGVRIIVTPGYRCESHDRDGGMTAKGSLIHNGQINAYGQMYVVRDDYFEPGLGHLAEKGLAALAQKSRLGRPTLLESHRFNYVDDPDVADAALSQLDLFLEETTQHFPNVHFMSTAKLAGIFSGVHPDFIQQKIRRRINVWLLRVREVPTLWRAACLSGMIMPALVLYRLTRS